MTYYETIWETHPKWKELCKLVNEAEKLQEEAKKLRKEIQKDLFGKEAKQ